jgi:DNA-binding NarL/FixJ family response regulator
MTHGALNILIADDHALIRDGMRGFVEVLDPNYTVSGAATLDEALAALSVQPVELLLIDLDMPGMLGISSLRALREGFPELKISVLSASDDRQIMLEALGAGLNGYILKSASMDETARAIETLLAGRVYFPMASSQKVHAAPLLVGQSAQFSFTPRQKEVMASLALGHSNKEIARDLNLGEGTVKIHVAAIFRQLSVQNRTEAALRIASLRLT